MSNGTSVLRIVVALARDTLDVRPDLSEAVEALAELAAAENRPGRVEVVAWWVEGEAQGFFRESPHVLLEEIRRAHNPDVIIGVFWRRFGTASLGPDLDIEQELEQASQQWGQSDHPAVMLFFCENNPADLTAAEKQEQRTYIIQFRGLFQPGTFWRPYKKRSEFRTSPHREGLREVVYAYLLEWVRRWKPAGAGTVAKVAPEIELRAGQWKYVNQSDLIKLQSELGEGHQLNSEDAVSYFDGEEPKWKYTVSESIPRRKVVEEIKDKIAEAAYEKRLRVTLLIGPGGEGKSTILQQVAVDLTLSYPGIHVIWGQRPDARLDASLIQQLLGKQDSFVIICDNAALIAGDVFELARDLSGEPHVNVQFLLASQTVEWQWKKAPSDGEWGRMLGGKNFANIPIKRLTPEDAKRIIEKWAAAGTAGLGALADVPEDKRAQRLVDLAYEEGISNPNEGPLLGAMLLARKDDAILQGYVENILTRLEDCEAPGGRTLQDVFAYIAAIHADMAKLRADIARGRFNKRRFVPEPVFLSKPILARVLGCSVDQLEGQVLKPLADEKATSGSEYFVLTRHRRIAGVAKRILAEKFPFRFDARNTQGIYQELLRAARLLFLDDEIDHEEIKRWNNLPRLYFEEGELELAQALAKVLVDVEPYDPIPVVSWAHIYRDANRKLEADANKKLEAVDIFRSRFDVLLGHWKRRQADPDEKKNFLNKGYFSEWSVSEGQVDKHCFSTWLCGIALSDLFDERQSGATPFMMLLSELTSSLQRLYEKAADAGNATFSNPSHAETFLRACAAAAWLGLDKRAQKSFKSNFEYEKAQRNLDGGLEFAAKRGLRPITDPAVALDALKEGISLAWELREKDGGDLPPTLPDANGLSFAKLSACFEMKSELSDPESQRITRLTPRPTPRRY